jgi:hypothetical protein
LPFLIHLLVLLLFHFILSLILSFHLNSLPFLSSIHIFCLLPANLFLHGLRSQPYPLSLRTVSTPAEGDDLNHLVEAKMASWMVQEAQIAPAVAKDIAKRLVNSGIASIERLAKKASKNPRLLIEVSGHRAMLLD